MLKLLPTQWRRDEKLTFERSNDVVTDWPNYPFAAAALGRRRSQGHRRWRAWHRRHYQDDAADEAANLYRVLLLNDDYSPMDFVVHVLECFFNKDHETAHRIMLHVHQHGVGECGVFTYEVAETKVM